MNLRKKTLSVGICLLFAFLMFGQIDYNKVPDVTNKIFINDVYVQKSPDVNIGLADILIEGGLIKQINTNITPPLDAKVIEADSSYAYAGFIDALSHVGIAKKDNKGDRPEVRFKGFPPNNVAGITPEVRAGDQISINDASITAHRESGFTIAHVVPRGRMLPGQGAIISLDGNTSEDIIIKNQSSAFLQFKGARGYYPNTVIGVMAKWRDLYRKAYYHNKNIRNYKASSVGVKRPSENKVLNALIPITSGERPVFMTTNKAKDIFRALELQKELGYQLVLSDVKQIGAAQKHLKNSNINVLLSMDLPKEEKGDKKDKDSLDINTHKKNLIERKAQSFEAYMTQASILEKAKIPFAFTMISSKPKDLKTNVLRLIKSGSPF